MRKTKEESKLRIDRVTKLTIRLLKLINIETKKLIVFLSNLYSKLMTNLNNINYNFLYFPIYNKFYRVGSILTFIFILPLAIRSYKHSKELLFSIQNDGSFLYYLNIIFTWFVVISFSLGFIFESLEKLEKLYSKYKDKAIFKILIASLLFAVYSMSEILISNFINVVTGIDSSYLSDGKIVLKLIFIPYAWLLLALFYSVVRFLITTIFVLYSDIKSILKSLFRVKNIEPTLSISMKIAKNNFTRQVKQLILILLIFGSVLAFSAKDTFIQDATKNILIRSEYFENTSCKNLQYVNYLVADIGGGLYSVYNKQSKSFTISKCELERAKHTTK